MEEHPTKEPPDTRDWLAKELDAWAVVGFFLPLPRRRSTGGRREREHAGDVPVIWARPVVLLFRWFNSFRVSLRRRLSGPTERRCATEHAKRSTVA